LPEPRIELPNDLEDSRHDFFVALPRTEVTKKVWDYIKKNGLQDKVKRTMINADSKLKEIFNKAQVSMFEMTKLINNHLK
jgi:chromatin remodeling complex protein RSC6